MPENPAERLAYTEAGIDTAAASAGLERLLSFVRKTHAFRTGIGEPLVPVGFFASVIKLTEHLSLAISTDGVGSKSAVAQQTGRYESIGWDCVAVNVNDILCTGAEPVALVDYISVQYPHEELLAALGKGLHDGALRAGIAIVGGELSQHPDTLTGPREGYGFDIAGTCVGILDGRPPITGAAIEPGDVVLGMPSDGIHANGLTLARHVLLADDPEAVGRELPECGTTVGDELLRPTHIYVPEVLALLRSGVDVRGLVHVSGGGLLNLTRLAAPVGYRIDAAWDVPPIFGVIQREGRVDVAEMFRVFNMGIGFCAVVPEGGVDAAIAAAKAAGGEAQIIGRVVAGPERRVELPAYGLVGTEGAFRRSRRPKLRER